MSTLCLIDHIAITATNLERGEELVFESLGVHPQKGGEHPKMGTHNLLLRLGDSVYLEVIAIDSNAQRPDRPRWFALDKVQPGEPARLKTWVVGTNDIHQTLPLCPEAIGEIVPMSRGEKNWLITIPEDGSLALGGSVPALIEWQTDTHPASGLTDYGLSLKKLQLFHPESERIRSYLAAIHLSSEIEVEILQSDAVKLIAFINTPTGLKQISV